MKVGRKLLVIALLVSAFDLEGCTPRDLATERVDAHVNTSAEEYFAITARLENAPAAPRDWMGVASFDVVNADCVPMNYGRAIGGVRLPPSYAAPLKWEQTSDGGYVALVALDGLVDEDYFGLGICRWVFRGVTVSFGSPKARFLGGLSSDEVRGERQIVQYYLASDFHAPPVSREVIHGELAGRYLASAGPQFTLTLISNRAR